ncbi:hypothetical protein GQX74_000539 [Glossina fuscipes]|nr:hypothetical protein GQX74_000539 [Glossina fuscipes]
MSETPIPAVVTVMSHDEESEEVRTLLLRHQERIILDLGNTDLLTVLVKNSVLSQSEEDLLLKPYTAIAPPPSPVLPQTTSAPSSVSVIKRKLCAVISNASNSSNSSSNNNLGTNHVTNSGSGSGSAGNNSPSVSVIDDPVQNDNCSLATTSENNAGVNPLSSTGDTNSDHYSTKEELRSLMLNDAEILRLQCSNLIEIIAKSGFEKFKQFCYAIENECPQLIEDLINDRLKCGYRFLGFYRFYVRDYTVRPDIAYIAKEFRYYFEHSCKHGGSINLS